MRWLPQWSWRRLAWAAALVGGGLAVLGVAAVLAPPYLLRRFEAEASATLRRPVTIGRVRVNPYTVAVAADSVLVRDVDGDTLAAWRHLQVNLSLATLVTRAIVLDAVTLDGMRGRVAVRRDGALSVADIIEAIAARPSSGPLPEVRIGRVRITDARFAFADSTKAPVFARGVGPLALSLDDFSSRPDARNAYGLAGAIGTNERFAWQGTLQVAPFRSEGTVSLEGFSLVTWQPFWREALAGHFTRGTVSVRGRYVVDLRPGARRLELQDGALALADVALAEPGGADAPVVAEIGRFDVRGVRANAVSREATVGAVVADGGTLALRRGEDRRWNLERLVPQAPAAPAVPARRAAKPVAADTAGPWRWRLDTLRLARWNFSLDDVAPRRPVRLALRQVGLGVSGVSSDAGAPVAFDGRLSVGDSGGVAEWRGEVVRQRGKGQVRVALREVDVRPLDPYLAPYFNVTVTRGRLGVEGTATFDRATSATPAFGFTGDFRVSDFAAVDADGGRDFLRFGELRLARMRYDQTAEALAIGEVSLQRAGLELGLEPDGTFSVDRLRVAAAAPADTASAPLRIVIGALKVRDGRIRFTDRTVTPAVRLALGRVTGTFGELSSDDLAHATFDVRAAVDNVAPLAITGRLAPLTDAADSSNVGITLRGFDLLGMEPYSAKYAGRMVRRGQAALETRVRIVRRQLDARSVLTLDGFRFGDKVESADATAIPLPLVFAILRDRKDRIVFDVPVTGNLDDPSFGIWRVVGRAVKNVLLAVVESPFKLLAALAGGGDEATPIDHAEFAPGAADVRPAEEARLAKLASALDDRPDLQLIVEPWADDSADPAALRIEVVRRAYREQRWAELRARGAAPVSPDSVAIEPVAWERFLRGRDSVGAGGADRAADRRDSARTGASSVRLGSAASAPPPPLAQVEARVVAATPLPDGALAQLATDRARRLRDALINRYGIAAERVRLAEVGGRPRETPRGWVLFKVDVP